MVNNFKIFCRICRADVYLSDLQDSRSLTSQRENDSICNKMSQRNDTLPVGI